MMLPKLEFELMSIKFRLLDKDNSNYRLTLDEEDDYLAIKELYSVLNCKTDFNYKTLIKTLKLFPYIEQINKNVKQKEEALSY